MSIFAYRLYKYIHIRPKTETIFTYHASRVLVHWIHWKFHSNTRNAYKVNTLFLTVKNMRQYTPRPWMLIKSFVHLCFDFSYPQAFVNKFYFLHSIYILCGGLYARVYNVYACVCMCGLSLYNFMLCICLKLRYVQIEKGVWTWTCLSEWVFFIHHPSEPFLAISHLLLQ